MQPKSETQPKPLIGKPRRFQFSLKALIIASVVAGAGIGIYFWWQNLGYDELGQFKIADDTGQVWNVSAFFKTTNNSIPPGVFPRFKFIAYNGKQKIEIVHQTRWRFWPRRACSTENGLEVYLSVIGDPSGLRFEIKNGEWKVCNEKVYLFKDLFQAAASGADNSIERLLGNGQAINTTNDQGQTALHIAALNNHPRFIWTMLYYHNPDLTIKDKNGKTASDCTSNPVIKQLIELKEKKDIEGIWNLLPDPDEDP